MSASSRSSNNRRRVLLGVTIFVLSSAALVVVDGWVVDDGYGGNRSRSRGWRSRENGRQPQRHHPHRTRGAVLTNNRLVPSFRAGGRVPALPAVRDGSGFGKKGTEETTNDNNDDVNRGYKFGDLTRSLGRKVTGDENYKFGDISRALDEQAKARVTQLTGREEYKFGDLSAWADSRVKEKIANYTGKANYQVGDISKEVLRRVGAGEYDLEDVLLAFRVLLQMGASFTPIARLLPVKVLLELLNVGLAQDIGGKVMGGIATTLDERFKTAITGDPKYQLGDLGKQQLAKSLSRFTGKDSYSVGDITQAVATRIAELEKQDNNSSTSSSSTAIETTGKSSKFAKVFLDELSNNDALVKWDRKLLEQNKANQ